MKISGFTMVRNATKLYYPVKASIESILPIVDEFVVALGNCDADDETQREIESINSDKIRIVHTVWDLEQYPHGGEYAHQTDIAKNACTGDWLFYLQSDEVIHEKYLPVIRSRCEEMLHDEEVEGLVFDYVHFWGDYDHHIVSHVWYPKEIRIVRNRPDIHSWRDAQSFRRIPQFDGRDYFQKADTFRLKVAPAHAAVYHYGWVRPPRMMQKKRRSFVADLQGKASAEAYFKTQQDDFDYGDLSKRTLFKGTHPAVMRSFMSKFDWKDELTVKRAHPSDHKHDRLKYRILTFLEQTFLGGRQIGGFKNYTLLNK
ncbi:hypothetical protein [Paraflavitalea sp. CAU 1676]|uniref:hypothetical protein n=1 Tax=Paraflavitalea sp. CAU 1676 TaxID=3032598 RepID=UPI0023DADE09|nr:hypothetical protein [Paraflavitalea sp. CAU 1676]MDF2190804.1 hypothetical protein [Paraflavitalea sp. CAU 1676]